MLMPRHDEGLPRKALATSLGVLCPSTGPGPRLAWAPGCLRGDAGEIRKRVLAAPVRGFVLSREKGTGTKPSGSLPRVALLRQNPAREGAFQSTRRFNSPRI